MMAPVLSGQSFPEQHRPRSRAWPTPRLQDFTNWKRLTADVDVDSDYDKRWFRTILDAHDHNPDDIARVHAVRALWEAEQKIDERLRPLDELLEKYDSAGGMQAINDPERRQDFEAVARIAAVYRKCAEELRNENERICATIQDDFLREEEAVRFEM
jgi:hypothetical protein